MQKKIDLIELREVEVELGLDDLLDYEGFEVLEIIEVMVLHLLQIILEVEVVEIEVQVDEQVL